MTEHGQVDSEPVSRSAVVHAATELEAEPFDANSEDQKKRADDREPCSRPEGESEPVQVLQAVFGQLVEVG